MKFSSNLHVSKSKMFHILQNPKTMKKHVLALLLLACAISSKAQGLDNDILVLDDAKLKDLHGYADSLDKAKESSVAAQAASATATETKTDSSAEAK